MEIQKELEKKRIEREKEKIMSVIINNIKNEELKAIASRVDADKNGKLEKEEIEIFQSESEKAGHKISLKPVTPKVAEEVSFFDSRWSGHQIEKLTGKNVVTDWLQDKDKVCTDGKDDGSLTWTQLLVVKGISNGWLEAEVDLSAYAGQRIYIGFNAFSDSSVQRDGWYIDDVALTSVSKTGKVSKGKNNKNGIRAFESFGL